MPQYRKLYLKTTESLDINEMPDDFARLLWLMLPLITCREGRGMDNPAWVKSKAMPLREDVTQARVEAALCWYASRGMIERYTVGGRGYFEIVNWSRYQGDTSREAESNYPRQDQANGDIYSRPTPDLLLSNSCSDTDTDTDTDTEKDAASSSDFTDFLDDLLLAWSKLFNDKPQPRRNTKSLQSKIRIRFKENEFREYWREALERAAKSSFLHGGPWFTLQWFVSNDEHWQRCYDGNYDGKADDSGTIQAFAAR